MPGGGVSCGGISRRGILLSAFSLFSAGRRLCGQDTTFKTDVKVVSVLVTVRDKQGKIVRNLTKDDFSLEEDERPQTIRYFSQETNLPLTLGLLVDTSLSQRRVLGQERSASYRFLDQVLREDKDVAFLIHFDREVELLQDLTSSRKKLESALEKIETPQMGGRGGGGGSTGTSGGGGGGYPGGGGGYPSGRRRGGYPSGSGGHHGGTMLYDSVLLASDELMKKQHGRKALIVLTDGVDNGSKVSLTAAIESAQRADTLVYSILFADDEAYSRGGGFSSGGMGRRGGGYPRGRTQESRPDGKKILERLSSETGGGFFAVSKKLPIEQIYDRIQEELRNQYSLGYTPERADAGAGYHKIRLTTKQKGMVVQARDGYYPQG